jgi:hypothetical protein
MPQLEYSDSQLRGVAGDIASLRPYIKRARVWPKKKQITTVTVGGADDGDYTIRIVTPDGEHPLLPIDSSFTADSDSVAELATALAAKVNQGATVPNLRSVVHAVATATEVVLTAVHAGKTFTVSFPDNESSNLSQAATQSAAPGDLPIGVALVDVDGVSADLPGSTATADELLGLLMRGRGVEYADTAPHAGAHRPGDTLEVLTEGDVYVMPEEEVAVGDPVYVRIEGSTEQVGALRKSVAGTAQVNTIAPVADQLHYGFQLRHRGETYSVSYSPTDGTTAVADAIDGLYDALVAAIGGATAANNGIGLTITESATLLTITTDAGTAIGGLEPTHFELDSEAATVVAVVGTADVDAIEWTRARWLSAGGPTSGEVAVLAIRE